MRTPTVTPGTMVVLTVILCLAPFPAAAGKLYSTHAALHTESPGGWFGPASGDGFARAVATGDFNGDGADDLATGVPYDDNALGMYGDSGIVVVRYGVLDVGLAPGLAYTVLSQMNSGSPDAPEDWEKFGGALASGDFDADGYTDLAVGVPEDRDSDGWLIGGVQIHYGSAAGLDLPGSQFFSPWSPGIPDSGSHWEGVFGTALAAGDFDADSFVDLAIGHPTYLSDFDLNCGRAVILYGSAAGLSTSRARNFTQNHPGMDGSNETNDRFGTELASGDFDGDGYADLAVGVPGENDGGGVHVIMGSAGGLTEAGNGLWTQNDAGVQGADEPFDQMGASLAVADFDGDGYDDLAVGVPSEDLALDSGGPATDAGAVHIFFGSPGGISGSNSWMLTASSVGLGTTESNDVWGSALAAADFGADGYADLAIGAKGEGIGTLAAVGEVTILPGSSSGLTPLGGQLWQQNTPGVPEGNEAGDQFGFALAAGDFDGNGYPDLVVGAPTESTAGFSGNGAEWVLYGYLFADGLESGGTTQWQAKSPIFRDANNLAATTAAKLGTTASQYGLQVGLVDPSLVPSKPVYVMAGPNLGFANETTLKGTFFVDPQSVTMSSALGLNTFQIVTFTDGVAAGSKTRLTFDLYRNVAVGEWTIIATYWNDGLGGLAFGGAGGFALVGDPNGRNNRIDFEWSAGNPGHLDMWRTRFANGAPDANGRVPMFSATLPGSQTAVINHVFAGMISGQDPGTFGVLYLDEFSFSR